MTRRCRSSATILVVEDDDGVADVLNDLLVEAGYQVLRAARIPEAEALCERCHPDLIILDLILPESDGLILLSDLRSRGDPVPVIVCSGKSGARDRLLSLKLGADDFVAKPFDVDEMEARVRAVLRRSRHPPAPLPRRSVA